MPSERTSTEQEIAELIAFYESRGKRWEDAACFVLLRGTGRLERYLNPRRFYHAD